MDNDKHVPFFSPLHPHEVGAARVVDTALKEKQSKEAAFLQVCMFRGTCEEKFWKSVVQGLLLDLFGVSEICVRKSMCAKIK